MWKSDAFFAFYIFFYIFMGEIPINRLIPCRLNMDRVVGCLKEGEDPSVKQVKEEEEEKYE